MLRDEILNMPAGRKMDELVAVKVLGFVRLPPPAYPEFQKPTKDGVEPLFDINPFSTDITSAWEVVEKLKYIKLVKSFGLSGVVWIAKIDEETEVFDKSAPLAICRAALLALLK